jgi:hypothetical protein
VIWQVGQRCRRLGNLLGRANHFWHEWAPIEGQLYSNRRHRLGPHVTIQLRSGVVSHDAANR